jgi:hypothetical protein
MFDLKLYFEKSFTAVYHIAHRGPKLPFENILQYSTVQYQRRDS